jgi:hypothetical protein
MKTKTALFTFVFISTLLLASCARMYYSPDSFALTKKHKTIAIMPPKVTITATKKVNAEALKIQQESESANIQQAMYSWMLKRKLQGRITQEILDVETTNARLAKAGYPQTLLTSEEICKALEVDGVINTTVKMSKPMSEAGAVVLGLITGFWGATNEVKINMTITDCNFSKVVWNYDNTYSGGVGSSPEQLVDGIMRNASRKMPYFR